jgi:hypothetical protein
MASMVTRMHGAAVHAPHVLHNVEALRLYREVLRTLRRFDDRATRTYYYNYARTVRRAPPPRFLINLPICSCWGRS